MNVFVRLVYDTILRVRIMHNHIRRDGLHMRLLEEYHDVTIKVAKSVICGRQKESVKSFVVKPTSSTRFLLDQVDLLDFRVRDS